MKTLVRTRSDALVFGLSLDLKALNLKLGMRILLQVWLVGWRVNLIPIFPQIYFCLVEISLHFKF